MTFRRLQRVKVRDDVDGYEWLKGRTATVMQDSDPLTGFTIVWFDGDARDEVWNPDLLELDPGKSMEENTENV